MIENIRKSKKERTYLSERTIDMTQKEVGSGYQPFKEDIRERGTGTTLKEPCDCLHTAHSDKLRKP